MRNTKAVLLVLVIVVFTMSSVMARPVRMFKPEPLANAEAVIKDYSEALNSQEAAEVHAQVVVSDAFVKLRDQEREILLEGLQLAEQAFRKAPDNLANQYSMLMSLVGLSESTRAYLRLLEIQASTEPGSPELESTRKLVEDARGHLETFNEIYKSIGVTFYRNLMDAQPETSE